jgi:hypothetical protein
VCLKFERICAGGEEGLFRDCEESSSEWALSCGDGGAEVGCSMTPTPSLLAEPSRPIAMGILRCCGDSGGYLVSSANPSTNPCVYGRVRLINSPGQHVIVADL